ncbi:MAG: hypothetical protein QOJ07_3809 [Thermoleophilaceae bacterium]|jgi:ribosomal protein S18 acetylase RimI-like enzyme|nr:hypothetical protein [Thermoleophilaceae bacterium]
MAIRPALPDDVDAIRALVERAYIRYVDRMGLRPAPMDEDYEARVACGQVHVAERPDGAVAGLIVLLAADDHVLVENVAVAPGDQGRGHGRALLAFAEEQARALRLPEVRLYTHVTMTENRAIYPHLGYREDRVETGPGWKRVHFRKTVAS